MLGKGRRTTDEGVYCGNVNSVHGSAGCLSRRGLRKGSAFKKWKRRSMCTECEWINYKFVEDIISYLEYQSTDVLVNHRSHYHHPLSLDEDYLVFKNYLFNRKPIECEVPQMVLQFGSEG